ncbi:MAG: Stp1/IreP family PP2C-type Ser/Thr phosphatase [Proteobacteria bacterium]|jgi:serine/threonine protein phosphatase PrpC|nr:Stp1/IreP family PP2C-type Ser/Thr phosphatase [Pseudomonadota bacterium]
MKVVSCGITDIGRKRQRNEDSYLVNDKIGLYIVADGMGGHAGGEFASKIAVSTVEEIIRGEDRVKSNVPTQSYLDASEQSSVEGQEQERLKDAINRAGNMIVRRAFEDPELKGMGTTSTVMFVSADKAYIAHVGDSRAYCVRGNEIIQITEDHSLVHEQLKSGLITEEEARTHQLKNIITRSVGVQEEVEVDTIVWKIQPGDSYLLCSDGLSNMMNDDEMQEIISKFDVEQGARELVDLANQRGGEDNITLILLKVFTS